MGTYIDAEDISQHFRQSGGLDDETIEELMAEQEYYVQTRLNLPSLPPDNPILKGIIRDLTIAACIYEITPASADNVVKADSQRREAKARLRELESEGLGVIGGSGKPGAEFEVINPFSEPFFSPADFGL